MAGQRAERTSGVVHHLHDHTAADHGTLVAVPRQHELARGGQRTARAAVQEGDRQQPPPKELCGEEGRKQKRAVQLTLLPFSEEIIPGNPQCVFFFGNKEVVSAKKKEQNHQIATTLCCPDD